MTEKIDVLFNPSSIVAVGCSKLKGETEIYSKMFERLTKNTAGWKNASAVDISDRKKTPKADLMLTVLPEKMLLEYLRSIRGKSAKYLLLMGDLPEETAKKVKELAQKKRMMPVGPGADPGIGNGWSDLAALSFDHPNIDRRHISVICQNSSFGYSILAASESRQIGLGKFICLGRSDVGTYNETLEYLASDEETKAICIQLSDSIVNRSILEAMRNAAGKKPLVVFYTGDEDRILTSAMKQIGAIHSESHETMLRIATAFLSNPHMEDDRVAIITNAPDSAGVLKRKLKEKGLRPVAPFPDTATKISKHGKLSDSGAFIVANTSDAVKQAVKEISQDQGVDAVIIALNVEKSVLKADDICDLNNKIKKPVFGWIIGREKSLLTENRWCPFISSSPGEIVEVIGAIYEFGRKNRKR